MKNRVFGVFILALIVSSFAFGAIQLWDHFRLDQETIKKLQKAYDATRKEEVKHIAGYLVRPDRMRMPTTIGRRRLYCFGNVLLFRELPDYSGVYIAKDDPLYRGGYPGKVNCRLVLPDDRYIEFFTEHHEEISNAEARHIIWTTVWFDNDAEQDCHVMLRWYYHGGEAKTIKLTVEAKTLKELRVPHGVIYIDWDYGGEDVRSLAFELFRPPSKEEKSSHYCAYLFNFSARATYGLEKI